MWALRENALKIRICPDDLAPGLTRLRIYNDAKERKKEKDACASSLWLKSDTVWVKGGWPMEGCFPAMLSERGLEAVADKHVSFPVSGNGISTPAQALLGNSSLQGSSDSQKYPGDETMARAERRRKGLRSDCVKFLSKEIRSGFFLKRKKGLRGGDEEERKGENGKINHPK